MTSLKQKIVSGVFWQGLERSGSQGISIAVSIILARLLAPEEFGIIALLMVFISLCNSFIDSGFGAALIQKKDADEIDFCTVFFFNIVAGILLYGLLFISAPWVAKFYDSTNLSLFLRVMALMLIINSFTAIQRTILNKRMLFHLSFRINWIALIVSGTTGVLMAYRGCGVWSLIVQQLTNAGFVCLLLWFFVHWRPRLMFSWQRAKSLFQFGWKLLISGFLDTLYHDLYSIVISKISNLADLSYYNRGRSMPSIGMGVINTTIGSVLFPAFAELQDDRRKMRDLTKRSLHCIMFAVIPVLTMLFVLAEPLVKILLTDKWLPSVIYMQLCCITFFFWPFHTVNLAVIKSCGRSDLFLLLEIIKKVQALLVIFFTYRYGVVTMVAAGAAMGLAGAMENGWCNRKLINYAPWVQLWDILPLLIPALLSGWAAHLIIGYIYSPWLQILSGGAIFTALYLSVIFVIGMTPAEILDFFKRRKV